MRSEHSPKLTWSSVSSDGGVHDYSAPTAQSELRQVQTESLGAECLEALVAVCGLEVTAAVEVSQAIPEDCDERGTGRGFARDPLTMSRYRWT